MSSIVLHLYTTFTGFTKCGLTTSVPSKQQAGSNNRHGMVHNVAEPPPRVFRRIHVLLPSSAPATQADSLWAQLVEDSRALLAQHDGVQHPRGPAAGPSCTSTTEGASLEFDSELSESGEPERCLTVQSASSHCVDRSP